MNYFIMKITGSENVFIMWTPCGACSHKGTLEGNNVTVRLWERLDSDRIKWEVFLSFVRQILNKNKYNVADSSPWTFLRVKEKDLEVSYLWLVSCEELHFSWFNQDTFSVLLCSCFNNLQKNAQEQLRTQSCPCWSKYCIKNIWSSRKVWYDFFFWKFAAIRQKVTSFNWSFQTPDYKFTRYKKLKYIFVRQTSQLHVFKHKTRF